MIKIKETSKRKYSITSGGKEFADLDLVFSPVTNKFNKIVEFTEDASKKLGKKFDTWFEDFLLEYKTANYDYAVVKKHIPNLMKFCDQYLVKCNINFNNYVNISKVSKTSIFFDAEELEKLIKVSNYLKLYFIVHQDGRMKLPVKFHKEVYNILIGSLSDCDIVFKLFKLVSSKTHRYNITDKTMWDYIKLIHCETTDMQVMSIFNFLMNNILVTCDTQSNPIPYFSSVIDQSIKWILRGVYKESVIYSDTINTEDIHTISGKDNLMSYCYNDTIGKLVNLASDFLEEVEVTDVAAFSEVTTRLQETSLISLYVTYPILSRVLEIPYRYFRPIPVEHSYLLNILTHHYLPEAVKKKYPLITKLLLHYNKDKKIVKTTYRIKNLPIFFKTFENFMTLKNKPFACDLLSSVIGKISRNSYISFASEKQIANFPLSKLETDLITFYNSFFGGKLDSMFTSMLEEIERDM